MNDDDKIIICSGKAASLAAEAAIIALKPDAERHSGAHYGALQKFDRAKRLIDEAVAEVEG